MKEKKPIEIAKTLWPKYGKFVLPACAGLVFTTLVADSVYLHVEMNRQAQVVRTNAVRIGELNEWVARASKPEEGFGHRVAKKICAAGRKAFAVIRTVDEKLNPQAVAN